MEEEQHQIEDLSPVESAAPLSLDETMAERAEEQVTLSAILEKLNEITSFQEEELEKAKRASFNTGYEAGVKNMEEKSSPNLEGIILEGKVDGNTRLAALNSVERGQFGQMSDPNKEEISEFQKKYSIAAIEEGIFYCEHCMRKLDEESSVVFCDRCCIVVFCSRKCKNAGLSKHMNTCLWPHHGFVLPPWEARKLPTAVQAGWYQCERQHRAGRKRKSSGKGRERAKAIKPVASSSKGESPKAMPTTTVTPGGSASSSDPPPRPRNVVIPKKPVAEGEPTPEATSPKKTVKQLQEAALQKYLAK